MDTPSSGSNEWYFSDAGQQRGPVSLAELRERARAGQLDRAKDLVWNSSMTEWVPAGRVPEIFEGTAAPPPYPEANPYAPPIASELLAAPEGMLPEIPPGSQPLNPVECMKRGITLINRNLVPLVLVALVYIVTAMVAQGILFFLFGGPAVAGRANGGVGLSAGYTVGFSTGYLLASLLNNALSVFLWIGLIRVSLNVASGQNFDIGQLFSGGPWFLRALLPAIAVGLVIGLLSMLGMIGALLAFAGIIYVSLRYGMYLIAIVDRNLGVAEALKYSHRLTQNSPLQIFVLGILMGVASIAGVLACVVGLLYAIPLITVAFVLAYRWLQYGSVVVTDEPGTVTPVLNGRIPGPPVG